MIQIRFRYLLLILCSILTIASLFCIRQMIYHVKIANDLIFSGSLSTMGAVRLFCIAWEYNMGWSCGNGGRTYLLFRRRCISSVKRRFPNSENSTNTVSNLKLKLKLKLWLLFKFKWIGSFVNQIINHTLLEEWLKVE